MLLQRRATSAGWRLWRVSGASASASGVLQIREYGTKKELFRKKMMDDFFEYQESLTNPDLVTFLQRTKNILSSQWRCQLVTASTAAKRDEKLHASIVQYGFFQKPYICLTNKDKLHKTDLIVDSNATVFVGHTDPPPLMETIKLLGKVPPHVIVTGVMAYAEDSEVRKVKEEMLKINAEAKEIVEIGGQALGPIFEASKELLTSQFEAREDLFKPENETTLYLFRPRSCQYVDLAGEKHEVDLFHGLSPTMDVFSSLYAGLIEGINQSEARRFALKVFCVVNRHVKVEEALLYSIDRRGFDIFVKVLKGASADWRGYRFNFVKEVRDAVAVCRALVDMENSCWEVMSRSPVLASVVSRAAAAAKTTSVTADPAQDEAGDHQETTAEAAQEQEAASDEEEQEEVASDEGEQEAVASEKQTTEDESEGETQSGVRS